MASDRNASVAVHLVVLTVLDDELVALVLVDNPNRVRLPGGLVLDDEDLLGTAERELWELTGLESTQVHVEQLATYGAPRRVTVAYLAVIPAVAAGAITATDAETDDPDGHGDSDDAHGADEVEEAEWLPVDELLDHPAGLASDHHQILADGVERVRASSSTRPWPPPSAPTSSPSATCAGCTRRCGTPPSTPATSTARCRARPTSWWRRAVSPSGESGRPARLYRRGDVDRLHPALLRPTE